MKKTSRTLPTLSCLALAVLLPILMTGTAAAQNLLVTNGTSTNFSSGTNSFADAYVGSTNNGIDGNSLTVANTNTFVTNSGGLTVGYSGSSNSMVITNGGKVQNTSGFVGYDTNASNNSVLVTGTNSFWMNSMTVTVGSNGVGNSLVILDGGKVQNTSAIIGVSNTASNNSVTVSGANSLWTNSGGLTVGNRGGGNSMVISNGGKVHNGGSVGGTIGLTGTASNSSVLVTGTNSLWTNSGTTVGSSGASNSLVISNGGKVANSFVGVIGTTVTGSNNWVLVTGTNSLWTNTRALSVGVAGGGNSLTISDGGTVRNAAATFIGSNSVGNSVLVTGSNSLWAITSSNTVGRSGSGNSMVISNGGKVQNTTATIGHDVTATNNWALVTGAGSTWSNSSTLTIGGAFNGGGSGTLTVANGGLVAASDIAIASGSNSIGTLNIGRFGTNDTAGTINTATIAFGAGTGAINFNQSDSTTLSAAISGNGSVNQLGSGTTTLSVSNSYTGDTTISAGTLRLTNENAAGTGSVIQTTMASLVEFLGGGRMTNRMTAFQYSFANSFEAAGQVTLADTASSIAVASGATVTGSGSFIGTGGLTKKGLGTLSLTAGNSFSGPLSVEAGTLALVASGSSAAGSVTSVGVSSGATLLVSQSNQMNNSATVTLSGGTITRGSDVSEVFGNLNLTQSSFLDFGSGTAGTMTFGTYTPSALLTINSFGLGNTLVFGSNLTDSINNTSLFQFSGGFTSAWNGTSTFTITAIPETSTCVAALGLLALGALPLVRRNRARVS